MTKRFILSAVGVAALASVAGLLVACDSPSSACVGTTVTPGFSFSITDAVTHKSPGQTVTVAATASDGKVTTNTGQLDFADSTVVKLYVGPGTYTVSLSSSGYKTLTLNSTLGQVFVGECSAPATEVDFVALTRSP